MDMKLLTYDFFFFNDTATTEIYTLSLHDALPISRLQRNVSTPTFPRVRPLPHRGSLQPIGHRLRSGDRKSTRLNSSHGYISYAVFCLKKKKREEKTKIGENVRPRHIHVSAYRIWI